jgi:hypothetical protein
VTARPAAAGPLVSWPHDAPSPKARAEKLAIGGAAGLAVVKLVTGLAINSIGLISAAADSLAVARQAHVTSDVAEDAESEQPIAPEENHEHDAP